jgi:XTP/dITP diphosphohydrolase
VLLGELQGVSGEQRDARFYCVLLLAWPDGRTVEGRGFCRGTIACAPRGSGGFGYDPVFCLPSLGLTAAELPAAQKHTLSHRGRAARNLLRALASSSTTLPTMR